MIRLRAAVLLLFSLVALLSISCLQLTGGGTDTETGGIKVYGEMVDSTGTAAPGTEVLLIPALHNPLLGRSRTGIVFDTTDANGKYGFTVKDPGVYNLQSRRLSSASRSLISGISVEKRDIVLPADTLHATGSIEVLLPDSADTGGGFVYIPGTTLYGQVSGGHVVIDSVPAGIIPAIYYIDRDTGSAIRVIKVGASVSANDTAVIADYHTWNYSQKLFFNTTPAGADLTADVYDFPVLVRLTKDNFTFGEAADSGRDVRFTKASGSPLKHQVEQWDRENGTAAVWVLLDTVCGNSSSQYITFHWGNGGATNRSNGHEVFDTANGFAAVWHLSETAGPRTEDATANGFYGVSNDSAPSAPAPAEGIIGRCRQFDGKANGIVIPNSGTGKLDYPADGRFTLSAWVYLRTFDSLYHPIICKGDDQWGLQIKEFGQWEVFVYQTDIYYCARQPVVSTGEWKYITGVRDSDKIALYLNGTLVSDSTIELPWPPKDTTRGVYIGSYPTRNRYWNGLIDEVRVQGRVMNEHWIRLCYMNQRRDDKLVVFGPR